MALNHLLKKLIMETIKVKIDWDKNYGAVSDSVTGCVAVDTTLSGVKEAYASALELHFKGMKADGEQVSEEYRLDFELSVQALLHSIEGKTTLTAIHKTSGINLKQLSHYYTGEKKPRPEQRKRIVESIRKIGKDLVSVV
jgi:predicted RNase H-like HicB family nuclease